MEKSNDDLYFGIGPHFDRPNPRLCYDGGLPGSWERGSSGRSGYLGAVSKKRNAYGGSMCASSRNWNREASVTPCPHAAARCWIHPGGSWSRYKDTTHRSIANTVVYTAVADKRIRNIWGK